MNLISMLNKIKLPFVYNYQIPENETRSEKVERQKKIAGSVCVGNISVQRGKFTTESEASEKRKQVLSYDI